MSRRYLRIKIDAKVKECGKCDWLHHGACRLFTDGDYEDTLLAPVAAPRFGYVRCAACLAAEVKS
jgi:hypothetical protein